MHPTDNPALTTAGMLREVSTTSEDAVDWLLGTPLRVAGIVLGAVVIRWLVHRAIRRVVDRAASASRREHPSEKRRGRVLADAAGALVSERRSQRAQTIGSVLRSIASFVIFGMAFVTVLDEVGIPVGPLLASAGVAGVALGFGAQSLVRDFLSGIFMILEDQYGVGDLVDTGEAVGTVEEVTLRVTRLRDASGIVWYVRNGEILRIGNHSQGWSTAIIDVSVAYTEDIPKVQEIIRVTADAMAEDEAWTEKILDDPVVAGVESVTGTSVTIRVIIKCGPNEHWGVQRELRERIKEAFDRDGIRVPVPVYPGGPGPGAPGTPGGPT